MKLLSYLFVCLFLCAATLGSTQGNEQEIRKIIQERANLINSMRNPLDVKKYMDILTPNYTATRSDYLVDGTVNHTMVTKESMQNRINSYALNSNNPLTYTLDKINFINVLGSTAVANYTGKFEIKSNGKVTLGGFQNVTTTFVNTNQGWKISRSQITEVRTTMTQYTCKFQMFTQNKESFMAKVSYPTGSSFETDFLEVDLDDMGGNNYMLNTNKADQFEGNNGTLKIPSLQTGVMRSAVATSPPAVFRELIKYYYPQNCPEASLEK